MNISSEKIRNIRYASNLTQENLASELGYSKSRYSDIEKNPHKYPFEEINRIANTLGVSSITFFSFDNEDLMDILKIHPNIVLFITLISSNKELAENLSVRLTNILLDFYVEYTTSTQWNKLKALKLS